MENSISDLTVDEAKQTAMSMERDLVSHLDPDRVVSVDQLQVGGFFSVRRRAGRAMDGPHRSGRDT